MIQTLMKKVPEGKTLQQFIKEVEARLPEYSDGAEGAEVIVVTPENFNDLWNGQENLKKEPEIEAKYRKLAAEQRVIAVEIDW